MSHIDDLIAEHCPDGVEYRALGEVGKFIRGAGLQKKDLFEEGVPAIHYGQIHTHYGTWATETKSFTTTEIAAKLRHARKGDLLIATTSEDDEAVAKATAWLGNSEVVLSGDAFIYRHDLEPRYVSYYFQTGDFQTQKRRHITGTKVRRISASALATIRIPVPPLPVQQEIVRILDQFTALEAELEAELEAHRKQYEYYRSTVLEIPFLEETRALGSLAEFRYGYTAKAEDSGAYRFLRITDISDSGKLNTDGAKYIRPTQASEEYIVESGDILVARTGATFGKTLLVEEDQVQAIYASFLIRIRFPTSIVIPSFYWHFAQSDLYWRQANALVSKSSQPQFNANAMKLLQVPAPPLEEQRRIVGILDEFDALVNDISVGLPAELTARRKQYEYYRDKLLTFKEKS